MQIPKEFQEKIDRILANPFAISLPIGFSNNFPEAYQKNYPHLVNPNFIDGLGKVKGPMQIPREKQEEAISRYMVRYRGAIHNENTRKTYVHYFEEFLEYSNINHLELVSMDVERRQWLLEKWTLFLASRK